jgi:NADH:ubiquinone oxidoreductase subunit 5 (subunit L)/multisubunit Na+/H+ antiporter MnhA subunit
VIRWVLGLVALPVGGYGVWLLLSRQELDQLTEAGLWLVAGVVAHDLAITAVVLVGGLVVALLPAASRAPAAVGLVVVGSLSLVAIPVLGGFGEISENPTHLDRPYVTAWVCVVAAAVLIVVLAGVVRSRKKEG